MIDPAVLNEEKRNFTLFAQNIVRAKGRRIFAENTALRCLSRSDSFFKELTDTYNRFLHKKITPQILTQAILAIETPNTDTDKSRLLLCAKLYEEYLHTMEKNDFPIPFSTKSTKNTSRACIARNEHIKQRTDFLNTVFFPAFEQKQNPSADFKKTDSINYLEFSDIQSEFMCIISEIKNTVDEGKANWSDFAVFVDKTEARQKFLDLMKIEQIPVVSSIYNVDYENLKHKINVYQKISEICTELKLEEFKSQDLKNLHEHANLKGISKSQKEICLEQLDSTLKSLLDEIQTGSPDADKEQQTGELSAVRTFYSFYKENRYSKAIESVIKRSFALFENTPVKDIIAGKIKSLKELQLLYDDILKQKPDFDSFKEILEWLPQDKSKDKNAVKLASLTADLKDKDSFKFVFAAGLTENNFPGANTSYPFISLQTNEVLCRELKKFSQEFDEKHDGFLKTDEVHFEQRYSALCCVMAHAVENITFTTHSYEAKKTALPSVFFKVLSSNDNENFKRVDENPAAAKTSTSAQIVTSIEEYEHVQTAQKVISNEDILRLNPSAISSFQSCPRKYFYKNLLNLKETSTFAASYGSIVHAVFELLNRKFLNSYNKETALALCDVLFSAKGEESNQTALQAGFKQTDIDLICAADELSLIEMKENFKNALEDFEMSGYFDETPVEAVCEKSFSFTVPELPGVVFDGRIDAILTCKNGDTAVVDYKTGKNKLNSLEYAISEYGVNFKSRTGKDPSNLETLQNAYDYQIPLYYFACRSSAELSAYKDKINRLGLLYVRPVSKSDGCDDDFVNAEKIDFYKEKILQNLKETVIDKILNETEFKPAKSFNCDNCSYKFLCDEGDDNE